MGLYSLARIFLIGIAFMAYTGLFMFASRVLVFFKERLPRFLHFGRYAERQGFAVVVVLDYAQRHAPPGRKVVLGVDGQLVNNAPGSDGRLVPFAAHAAWFYALYGAGSLELYDGRHIFQYRTALPVPILDKLDEVPLVAVRRGGRERGEQELCEALPGMSVRQLVVARHYLAAAVDVPEVRAENASDYPCPCRRLDNAEDVQGRLLLVSERLVDADPFDSDPGLVEKIVDMVVVLAELAVVAPDVLYAPVVDRIERPAPLAVFRRPFRALVVFLVARDCPEAVEALVRPYPDKRRARLAAAIPVGRMLDEFLERVSAQVEIEVVSLQAPHPSVLRHGAHPELALFRGPCFPYRLVV